jgi:uncharacterized membrane protein HdeD (DUF308 family)
MDLGIASVAAITVFAYLVGLFWKTADKVDDKWIPCVCGAVGCVLGIVAFLIKIPDFPANDVINAAAVGIVSGLAATGINQIGKQLFVKNKKSEEVGPGSDDDEEVDYGTGEDPDTVGPADEVSEDEEPKS